VHVTLRALAIAPPAEPKARTSTPGRWSFAVGTGRYEFAVYGGAQSFASDFFALF